MHITDKAAGQLEPALGLKEVSLVALSEQAKRNQDMDVLRRSLVEAPSQSHS